MGGEGAEQQNQSAKVAPGAAARVEVVDEAHHGGDSGVEFHGLDVVRHLFDGLMDGWLMGRGVVRTGLAAFRQVPDPVQKPLAALHRVVGPGGGFLKVADEHDIEPQGVRAVGGNDVVGVDHVAPALAHLLPALAQNHAVAGALPVGLLGGDEAQVIEELMQVEGGVLHAAIVPVHRGPVVEGFFRGQSIAVVGVHVAQEIPAGARPLGHGVRLPPGWSSAAGAGGGYPVRHLADGALAVAGGLVALHLRQQQRELVLRQGLPAACFTVHHGDGLAPVALPGEHPVPQLVVDLGLADALLL